MSLQTLLQRDFFAIYQEPNYYIISINISDLSFVKISNKTFSSNIMLNKTLIPINSKYIQ